MKPGQIYRRKELLSVSKSADRVLRDLVEIGRLTKVEPNLYFFPRVSRWGNVPASLEDLVTAFLKTDDYLILTNADYNSLGLGLTQLWNEARVYNKKRHVKLNLGNYNCFFQRPNNGYPSKLSKEFLLIDLMNNLQEVGEDPNELKERIVVNLYKFDQKKIKHMSSKYGKVGTKYFFDKLLEK